MKPTRLLICFILINMCLLFSPRTSYADAVYLITINTAPLIGHPAGPFSLDFQLTDGSGTGDANNIVSLTNFAFGGGNAVGTPALLGGASGNLFGTVNLTDSSFFNNFTQAFSPGSTLSFIIHFTTNVDPGGTPDGFIFTILDQSGQSIPSLSLSTLGTDAFVTIDITSANPPVMTFGSDPSRVPAGGGGAISIPPPTVEPVAAVPEPATILLFVTGISGIVLAERKRMARVRRKQPR